MLGSFRIWDQGRFIPFVKLGLNGEALVSKSERVAFWGTRPLRVMGHWIAEYGYGFAETKTVRQDARRAILRLAIVGRSGEEER